MIPKIIHFCWISGEPYPEKIRMCVNSWKHVLTDYEIILWDKQRAESIGAKYVNGAIQNNRYAFAADFIRFFALYNYGGIYLDADVEVLKTFDNLLGLRYFVGKENSDNAWEPAVMGAEAEIPWMKKVLDFWENGNLSFTDFWGRPRTPVLPFVCAKQLKDYAIHDCLTIEEWEWSEQFICRFPSDWFSPKNWLTSEIVITSNSYCIHHFTATWHATNNSEVSLSSLQKITRKIRFVLSFLKHQVLHL